MTGLLCDAAQAVGGKLYVLGGGWTLCGPGQFQHALALKIEFPWEEGGEAHAFEAVLLDEEGEYARPERPEMERVQVSGRIDVRRAQGLPEGTPLDVPLVINLPPMQLPPGRGYVWLVRLDGRDVWRGRFRTRLPREDGEPEPSDELPGYL